MRRRGALLVAGVSALAAFSAELVSAQTAPSRPDAPAPPPPAPTAAPPELPPQEVAPSNVPPPEAAKPDQPTAPPTNEGGAAKSDGVEAPDKPAEPAPEPGKRQIYNVALVRALDKITAETMQFEVRAGQTVRWKGLVFTLRSCETSAPDEAVKDSMAFMTVRSEPQHTQSAEASREIFRGWMYASSPALNPLRHPVYDAWLIACRA
jgi:hypothetical protein